MPQSLHLLCYIGELAHFPVMDSRNPKMRKDQAERILLDEFIRVCPWLSFTDIQKTEAPDFVADFKGRRVGVELTRLLGSSEKQRESEEDGILDSALRKYQAAGNPRVGLTAFWTSHKAILKSDRAGISDLLAGFVARVIPPPGGICHHDIDYTSPLSEYLDSVTLERVTKQGNCVWLSARGGWFPEVEPAHILAAIEAKEPHVVEYRKYCDAVWLLIASEGDPSSWGEVPDSTLKASYASSFDRAFFMNSVPRKVFELSVIAP